MKTKVICLFDAPDTKPDPGVAERSYRRGCHQTASKISAQIARMDSLIEARSRTTAGEAPVRLATEAGA